MVCPRCGHEAIFDPYALWWLTETRRWPESFTGLRRHFYCGPCRQKDGRKVRPRILLTDDHPTADLPRPSEDVWRKSVKRRRT